MLLSPHETLLRNRWRYLSLVIGFFLFVAPFALLVRATLYLVGNTAEPTLHIFCFRMPIDWIFGGRFFSLVGSPIMACFTLVILVFSFLFGPLFCGWLCPVGSISEGLSRALPLPNRLRIKIKDTGVTVGLRYGFFVGFIAVSILVGYKLVVGLSSICCRYCTSSVLQNLSYGLFGNLSAVEYWHSGALIVLISWLMIGGIFMVGGRGWCLFFCPLGSFSNVLHKIGSKLGFYRIEYDGQKCVDCNRRDTVCPIVCPMWAIRGNGSVDRTLCISCKECVNLCPKGCYTFRRGVSNARRAA